MTIRDRRLWEVRAAVDVSVAALVAVFAVVEATATSNEPGPGERPVDAFAYALLIVASLCLVRRRQNPLSVLVVVSVAVSVFWLRGHGALLSVLGLPALYAAVVHSERRRDAWIAVSCSCAVLLAVASATVLDPPTGFKWLALLSMAAFLGGAVAAAVVIRNRERIFVDTERRAKEAEADRIAEAERAVVRERNRIAREMHDVVAHGMSVVAVQAAAGREIVHADPEKAAQVFARIETVGRESLTELRRMLGVLRGSAESADPSLAPQPQLRDLAAAVELSVASGVPTEMHIEGSPRPVGPGVELAAYRIVQEALTNVRKHGGPSASATIRICYEPSSLVVEVDDDGRGAATLLRTSGTGHGIIGMRERVEIYGGEFSSGPRPGGGYAVRAVLPIARTSGGSPT
jgi:signal transduction histidine kinase